MVEPKRTGKFLTDAAIQIKNEHGIAKAVEFLSDCVNGLNAVEIFAICEGKAILVDSPLRVEWREDA